MQQSRDRGGEGSDIEAAFADPAFAALKARGAPFAVLRPDKGDVAWANAAAARHWAVTDAAALAEIMFGAGEGDGWLGGLTRGFAPGHTPRLARAGVSRATDMRAHTALIRAWTDPDGTALVALAVPNAAPGPADDAESWRRPAWTLEAPDADVTAEETDGAGPGQVRGDEPEPAEAGMALARRSQLAVLRDRLSRAIDGAVTLRLLWRTDAEGAVLSIDASTFARLGSPLRFEGALPDAVAAFDPAGAGRLRAALATRATWAGVSIDLPVADAAATAPMALSASPVFGPERAFAGFRGFGTVDLGRLALAERRAPPADGIDADPAPPPTVVPVAVPLDDSGAAPAEAPDTAAAAAADDVTEPAAEAAEPAATAPPEPAAAMEEDAPPEPRRPANVVQLRAFQGMASGRLGATPVQLPAEPVAEVSAEEADRAVPAADLPVADESPATPEGEPLDDQLAFLALGEALRARIGAPAPASDVPPPPAARSGDPASPLLDRLPVAVLATVGDRPVFANPVAAARLGYGDPGDLLKAGETAVVSTAVVSTAGGASAGAGRIVLRDARGRTLASAARCVEVPWAGSSATLWLLSDAEDEAPVAAAAEPAEDRSTELLDRVDDAVALLDAAGRVRRLNLRGEGWFGGGEADGVSARSFTDLLAPESRPAALALLNEVRGQRDGLGAPPLRRDVVARTGEAGAVPMLLTLGRLGAAGFYATLRDVSALQRAEIDRARTERDHARATGRLPDLLAKVSHEIRTPLGAILGFAEVMMDERFGPLGNPRYKDYLKDIHTAGTQVVSLVDDLLDLSRIEAGQLDLDVAAVDLNRVVAEAVAQMQPEAHRGRIIMRSSLAGRIPAVLVDERSARQIVRNVLSNAVKFNEPGGQVIVSTAPGEAGAVLLRVRDTGVGMSDEEIAAALEPFGGLPARPAAHGNGLGLPLTRALVGANGASMTIRSRPREGTLVEVAFAAAAEDEARRPA